MYSVKYYDNKHLAEITAPTFEGFKQIWELCKHSGLHKHSPSRKRSHDESETDSSKEDKPATTMPVLQRAASDLPSPLTISRPSAPVADKPVLPMRKDTEFFGEVEDLFEDIVKYGMLRKPVCVKNIFPEPEGQSFFDNMFLDIATEFFEFDFGLNKKCGNVVQWDSSEEYQRALSLFCQADFGNGGMLIIPSVFHSMYAHMCRKAVMDTLVSNCAKVASKSREGVGKSICGGFGNMFVHNQRSKQLQAPNGPKQLNKSKFKGRRLFGWLNIGPGPATQTFEDGDFTQSIEVPVGHVIFYDERHRALMPGRRADPETFNLRMYFNFFIAHELYTDTRGIGCKSTNAIEFCDMPLAAYKSKKDVAVPMIMVSYPSPACQLDKPISEIRDVYPGFWNLETKQGQDRFECRAEEWQSAEYYKDTLKLYSNTLAANRYFDPVVFATSEA